MEQWRSPHWTPAESEPGRLLAQLANVRALIGQMAGETPPTTEESLDRAARIDTAYWTAEPVVQKRFDAIAGETAVWAAAAAQALMRSGTVAPRKAPAALLASEIAGAQRRMERVLGLN